jgi:hypothetical protein
MRRSAALFSLLLLLTLRPMPARASTATVTIGIWTDPATAAAVGVWTAIKIARLLEIGDQVVEHLKEDVRRARDPHSVPPRIVPVRPPRPVPIVDPLPLRKAS